VRVHRRVGERGDGLAEELALAARRASGTKQILVWLCLSVDRHACAAERFVLDEDESATEGKGTLHE
jgi:hypothetical protein